MVNPYVSNKMIRLRNIFLDASTTGAITDIQNVQNFEKMNAQNLRVYKKNNDGDFSYLGLLILTQTGPVGNIMRQVLIRNELTGQEFKKLVSAEYYYLEKSNVAFTTTQSLGGSNGRRRRLTKKNSLLKKGRGY